MVWLIEYLFSHVLTNPKNQLVVNDVERILGRKAKTFLEYAQETAETGIWNQVSVKQLLPTTCISNSDLSPYPSRHSFIFCNLLTEK